MADEIDEREGAFQFKKKNGRRNKKKRKKGKKLECGQVVNWIRPGEGASQQKKEKEHH